MVRIGGGVFPHIKEPDYLVSVPFLEGTIINGLFAHIEKETKMITNIAQSKTICKYRKKEVY